MNWLYDWRGEKPPILSETAVDCVKCEARPPQTRQSHYSPDTKCCQFSPFLSAFAAGQLLTEGVDLESIYRQAQGELVLTRLGLLHSHEHRMAGGRLCRYYDQSLRSCQIWRQRPATCFTFFCVSEHSHLWQATEMELLEAEAELLRQWHFHKKGSADDWARWGLLMEEKPVLEIPESLLFRQWSQAEPWFRESQQWLKENSNSISETL